MDQPTPALAELHGRWQQLQTQYLKRRGQEEALLQERQGLQAQLTAVQQETDLLTQVQICLQGASEFARDQARKDIEEIVSNALAMIFGSDISFIVRMNELRGRWEADFYVASTYGGSVVVESKPQESRGGGVVDVVSLALRVALLESHRPALPGPLILDEPAKHVSEEFAMNVAEFLRQSCQFFGRQVIMVTHNQHLAEVGDVAYHVAIKNGRSVVSKKPTGTHM